MDDEAQDWAFSDSGLAYNTGKPGRAKFKIIRVKPPTHNLSSKSGVKFKDVDTELTRADFTEQENDWNFKTTPIAELVLIVGECLAENDDELLSKEYMKNHPRTMNVESFDSTIHAHLDTMASGFIVQLLGDTAERRRFFTLQDRQDGLCSLRPLVSIKTGGNYKKCYWYSEFFVGDRDPVRETQARNIKEAISQYIANTMENLDVPVRPRASQLSIDERIPTSIDSPSTLQSICISATALYDETSSPGDLREIFTASQIARGSSDPCALVGDKQEGYWERMRQLGQGEMKRQDARRLLEAYKKLWPQAMNSFAETILTVDAVIQLNKGLCMGALRHLTEVLPDGLYRPLIFQFCVLASLLTFKDDAALRCNIVNAYQAVEGMMNCPFPESKTTVPLSADTTLYLASSRVSYNNDLIKTLDETIADLHVDCPANIQDAPVSSARLASRLAETSDLGMASELAKTKIQADALKMVTPLHSWRDYLSRDNEIHTAIVKKFTQGSSDAI